MYFTELATLTAPIFLGLYGLWYVLYAHLFVLNQLCVTMGLLMVSWTAAYYLWERQNRNVKVDPKGKAVLVTGCDTGFGHRLAHRLDQLGFSVYAGVLNPDGEGAQALKNKCTERMQIVKMNVTSEEDVEQMIETIKNGQDPLWAVVNNAGIAIEAPLDWGQDIDILRRTFDVNLFGVVRVTKACIALLRKTKGSRVVNVASIAGRVPAPFMGHYVMSKFAVRAFSNCLRLENPKLKVVTLEPTFYRTEIINYNALSQVRNKYYEQTPKEIQEFYGDEILKIMDKFPLLVDFITRSNIDEVVDAMIAGVSLVKPKLFYRCCNYSNVLTIFGLGLMPEAILDFLYNKLIFSKRILKVAKFVGKFRSEKDRSRTKVE